MPNARFLALAVAGVVRSLHLLGKWSGGACAFSMPPAASPIYRTAVPVQDGPGGAILAARRI